MQEYGVHCAPQPVVATEREGEIAESAACFRSRQVAAYPFHCADIVEGIAVVLRHSGGNREYVGVEDYVGRVESCLFCQQAVGSLADSAFAVEIDSLSLLVESHHHDSRAVGADYPCMTEKLLLAVFQRNGVHYGLASDVLQSRFYHPEIRGIYHPGNGGADRIRAHRPQKLNHYFLGIKQSIVGIDI